MMFNQQVKEWQFVLLLQLICELNRGLDRIDMGMKTNQVARGDGCTHIIHILFPKEWLGVE